MKKLKVGDRVRHNGGASGHVGDTGIIIEQGQGNPGVFKVKWDHSWGNRDHGTGWMYSDELDKITNSANSCVSTNPVVQNALDRKACNAAYSKALKAIMDSVKPYLDRRFKGDMSWRYPMLVITVLRKVCDTATMSAGRYDHQRPRHRVYDVECTRDGWKFQGNLICTGLLHRDDPDDVSTFDEYDMTLSLMNVGKATNAADSKALNASRSDAILADFKKFVKAQMSAAIAALETAKRDISAQAETSAKAAMSMRSTDEHEIIRDYGTKTAMAIGEAVSKLKAAKDNPLIL